jgi:minor histocompatibility antigen H13
MDHHFSFCQGDSAVLQFTGKWGARIYDERELIQMYIHLLLAALFPIIIGSHASLRRPPSAPAPKKTRAEDEDDDEIEPEPIVEGLSPSDAIMFPVLAGITLAILYYIIKWLEDPAILNRIMGWYFSGLGVFGIGKLGGDGLNVATTFLFPSVWSSGKDIYHVSTFFEPLSPEHNVSQVVRHWRRSVCTKAFRAFLYAYSRRL